DYFCCSYTPIGIFLF
nr:immunoglobulin light chain junction region [Macaca mulatta]MOV97030.1 immunoglobulin light chain junction region [Macaca mulatta]MOV99690.1 immunoglobulin light chain junction region [Macaca mulatta]